MARSFESYDGTQRTSPFNELLYVLCLHHMGLRSLPFSQQARRAIWLVHAQQVVAGYLVFAMLRGFAMRRLLRTDPQRAGVCGRELQRLRAGGAAPLRRWRTPEPEGAGRAAQIPRSPPAASPASDIEEAEAAQS